MSSHTRQRILVGNSFPLSLVRTPVSIRPFPLARLKAMVASRPVDSYWGHANTRPAAEALLGISLEPASPRPALVLSKDRRPTLDGTAYDSCFVLSPDYRPGFRPAIGSEVPPDQILSWSLLRIGWPAKLRRHRPAKRNS